MAESIDAELITVLLGQHTPDEVAGFQLALNDKLVIQMPYWFRKAQDVLDSGKSVVILFDELSLSREETRGALYTFFRDRHLHGNGFQIPDGKEVLIVAATNPGAFAPPFRSRCIFLPVPADRDYLRGMMRGGFGKRVANMAPLTVDSDPAYSNAPPPAPETFDASAAAVLNSVDDPKTGFWRLSEPTRFLILSGVVPHQTLNSVLKESGLDASALARQHEELLRALRALPRDKKHSMINNVLESFPQIDKNERAEAILSILDAIYDDTMADDLHTYFSTPRSAEVVKAVSEIDPEYMERRLKERGLLAVEVDKKGNNKVSGSLVARIQEMVKRTADQAG
jgi:hypothetical protein